MVVVRKLQYVRDIANALGRYRPVGRAGSARLPRERAANCVGAVEIDQVVKRRNFDDLAVETQDRGPSRVAQSQRAGGDDVEDRLHLSRRFRNDTKNLSSGRLIFQRLGEVVSALAQLFEQPRVLDGDDGLGSEVRHERNLLVGKGPDLLAENDERADYFVILEHGDCY